MSVLNIKRKGCYPFNKLLVTIDEKQYSIPISSEIYVEVSNPHPRITIAGAGYSSSSQFSLEDENKLIISTLLPDWFFISFLSLCVFLCSLGIIGMLPKYLGIIGFAILFIQLMVIAFVALFKRQAFFKIEICKK